MSTTDITHTASAASALRRVLAALLLLLSISAVAPQKASAISFALDSIAEWGKFPRFCVNVYRWGDRFFNSYDSTYVQGSGKRWNIKFKGDSWLDGYNFRFVTDGYRMQMVSRPSTTVGFSLTYTVHRMGMPDDVKKVHFDFNGINTQVWQLSLYYFFNHKHYSQGAAFYYSKIQQKSSGTMFAGLTFSGQQYSFDFSPLLAEEQPHLPEDWGNTYNVRTRNYGLRVGYAYNWVFHRGWTLGLSAAPVVGLRKGYINIPGEDGKSFYLSGSGRISLVYNHKKRWFYGLVAKANSDLIYDKEHSLLASNYSFELSAGFRFDLW